MFGYLPKPHNAGVPIFFASGWYGLDRTERTAGQTMYAKLCPVTGKGELALSSATARSLKFNSRFDRPYLSCLSEDKWSSLSRRLIGRMCANKPFVVSQRQDTANCIHRSRYRGEHRSETGTTYSVEVRKVSDNSLVASETGITGNTATIGPLGQDMQVYVGLVVRARRLYLIAKHRFTIDYYRAQRRLTQDGVERE